MIIIPSLINDELTRDTVIEYFASKKSDSFGIVAITPSFEKAKEYGGYGATVADNKTVLIHPIISDLKSGKCNQLVVFANRYDGIDLPDQSCRILIVDSLPYFDTLCERYEESCRGDSDITNIRLAQKIEQGLGRSVRGEKDYSVIIIIGAELVKFMKSISSRDYFSEQTRMQIAIGLEISQMATDDTDARNISMKDIRSIVMQSLSRDEGWKGYYIQRMNELPATNSTRDSMCELQVKEKEAYDAINVLDYVKAAGIFQKIVDGIESESDKGWYLQQMGMAKHFASAADANKIQLAAFKKNSQLLKPRNGVTYNKISLINEERISKIKEQMLKHNSFEEILMHCDSVLGELVFENDSEKFEKAIYEIGLLLGFASQRPDKEIRKGPDNLWGVGTDSYMVFECKNEVKNSRIFISKTEAGQMDQHCNWFESEYGKTVNAKYVMIIPTRKIAGDAYFSRDVEIMSKNSLKKLKKSIKDFINEFRAYDINTTESKTINEWLELHALDVNSLYSMYSEKPKRNTV